jgi:hypothetical protein
LTSAHSKTKIRSGGENYFALNSVMEEPSWIQVPVKAINLALRGQKFAITGVTPPAG